MPLARSRLLNVARYAMYFDGVDDYVRIPNSPSLNPVAVTLIAWVNPNDFVSERVIISKNYMEGNRSYEIRFLPGGWVRLVVFRVGDVITYFDSPSPAQPGVFSFIAGSYASGNPLTIYINTSKYQSPVYTGDIQYSSSSVCIGTRPALYLYFRGYIAQVLIYSRALSDTEIAWNYLYPDNPIRNGLILWFEADPAYIKDIDGDGVLEWLDLSGFGNHGKIYGATLQRIVLSPVRTLSPARILSPAR